ncbi:sodium/glucose cotransporter 4-like [Styela clava]
MDSTTTASTNTDLILRLNGVDIAVIVIYFALVMGVGIWAMIRANKGNVQGYFLAGRNIAWWAVGASLFSSNISSISIIGMAGSGASTGIAVAAYELNGLFVLILLGWIFVPVYLASGIFTMPEYLKRRFGGERIRLYLACLCMILYMFAKISTDLYSGAIFIQQSIGWSLYPSIIGLLVITVIFTITGGLTAVIFTDTLETVIMLGGSIVLMIMAFIEVGGYSGLQEKWDDAIPADANGSCGIPPDNAFHLFRKASDPDYPWPGVVFGISILSTWYFCTDQVLVQRSLASKNLLHAKGGSVLAALLKITPLFLMVMPGMISRVLFADRVACVTPEACIEACDNAAGCTNIAYPILVLEIMPQGLRGLMIAAMLAALMSSLTSVFNSAATIVSMDLWKTMRKQATDIELMVVGRIFVVILAAVSILWIPVLSGLQSGKMMEYVQSISSFLAPPICSTYLLAILWTRTNEPGAFWGLAVGLVFGLTRMLIEFTLPAPTCGHIDGRPEILTKVPFLYFAMILFMISMFVSIFVSLVTPPPSKEQIPGLTWWTRYQTPIYETDQIDDSKSEKEVLTLKNTKKDKMAGSSGDEIVVTTQPWWKTAGMWICGFEQNKTENQQQHSQARTHVSGKITLYENQKWGVFVNVCCLAVMAIGTFMWGYFA